MKTAISLPDGDFERIEEAAARMGVTRSEFFRLAAQRLIDEIDGGSELTAIANAVLARAGEEPGSLFVRESERILRGSTDW